MNERNPRCRRCGATIPQPGSFCLPCRPNVSASEATNALAEAELALVDARAAKDRAIAAHAEAVATREIAVLDREDANRRAWEAARAKVEADPEFRGCKYGDTCTHDPRCPVEHGRSNRMPVSVR